MAEIFPISEVKVDELVYQEQGVMAEAAMQREVAEVQTAMVIAKRFARNQVQAMDRILIACQRPSLAEGALYSYSRGGTDITGPSIRLAEAIAQQWGNLQFGIRELEQRFGESTVEAYAWDLETNTRQVKVFQVKHIRHTKARGAYALVDPRDIYEMVANQGARRLRSCILGIVPGDVVEAAVAQCETTLKAKADISPEAVQKMVTVFGEIGVTKEMIEKRIQRKLESITPAQIIALRKIYNSIKDGMSAPADWFEIISTKAAPDTDVSQGERIKEKLKEGRDRKPRSDKGTKRGPEMPQDAPEGEPPTPTPPLDPSSEADPPQAATPEIIGSIRTGITYLGLSEATLCLKYEVSKIEELDQASAERMLAGLRGPDTRH